MTGVSCGCLDSYPRLSSKVGAGDAQCSFHSVPLAVMIESIHRYVESRKVRMSLIR
jgi:hypothetical protein